jgi:hypothetical protein
VVGQVLAGVAAFVNVRTRRAAQLLVTQNQSSLPDFTSYLSKRAHALGIRLADVSHPSRTTASCPFSPRSNRL